MNISSISSIGQTNLGMDQVCILEDLGEHEALLVALLDASARRVDVGNSREPDIGAAGGVDGEKGIPRPVTIHLIA